MNTVTRLAEFMAKLTQEMHDHDMPWKLQARICGISRQRYALRLKSPDTFKIYEIDRLVAASITNYGSGLWLEFIGEAAKETTVTENSDE
jgi:hypothetical protein